MLEQLTEWFVGHGVWGLAVVAFTESSFFPIPPDTLLIPLVMIDAGNGWFLAAVTTLFSVLGAVLGYYIGRFFRDARFVQNMIQGPRIRQVEGYFSKYGGFAVGVAGFTPIPFKVFTIASGVFRMPMVPFLLGSVIGRGMRFFAVAGIVILFGEQAVHLIERYGAPFTLGVTAVILAGIWLAYRLVSRAKV